MLIIQIESYFCSLVLPERNHNIRIPGFASDEARMSATATAPAAKKAPQGTHMTLRSARLAAIQQAKKDTKLI